ncbi:helix-turn-helix transcriptional regulator [Photobacterium damselae subsp. damselae]|uniref:helix-turn-helix domain-containing protein n=1 Tax=Photobacterium damselae TaxID=38293 RepID=UPI00311AD2B1
MKSLKTIGERLQWARDQKSMSQAELGKACDASQTFIATIERGLTKKPNKERLEKIASILNIDFDWLIFGDNSDVEKSLENVELHSMGERLQWAREQEFMSQSELARACDVSHAFIATIEQGITKKPNKERLEKITSILNIELDWLIFGDNSDVETSLKNRELHSLGERLQWAREQEFMSRSELARACDVSHAFIATIEQGVTKKPNKERLEKIASILNVELDWLMFGDNSDVETSLKNRELHSLGERLQWAREQEFMSQSELAKACDVSRAFIATIERGLTKKPNKERLEKIASILNIELDWLIFGDNSDVETSLKNRELHSLGERLQWARDQKSMSQAELGKACDASKTFIAKIEQGVTKKPNKERLEKIASVLNIELDWLIFGDNSDDEKSLGEGLQLASNIENVELHSLGERLQWVREFHSMSQAELGKACDASQTFIAKIEQGVTKKPNKERLEKIASVLNVELDWLRFGDNSDVEKSLGDMDLQSTGERLKWAREQKLVSQAELANVSDVSLAFITKLERGETNNPRRKNLARVALVLGVDLDWLSTGDGLPYELIKAKK